jgi:hypothetical protein
MEAIVDRLVSAILSRWTVLVLICAFVLLSIFNRVDQLGLASLQSTHVSVATAMFAK